MDNIEEGKEESMRHWFGAKIFLHRANRLRSFKEGEIWWCGIGENVGVEINGKSEKYSRPVLVFKKLSRLGFVGIPLTSQLHTGSWYVSFCFHGRMQYAVLAQLRSWSTCRLYDRIGVVDGEDFRRITEGLSELYFSKKYDPKA